VGYVVRIFFSAVLTALALAGCSDDTPIKNFETKGLAVPSSLCVGDPDRFGGATKTRDIDLGNGCFVHNAYRVSSIGNVRLNQPQVMNCGVVGTSTQWMNDVVQPAAQDAFGEEVVGIEVPSAFACRPRNNTRGAKLSEHGMGNAIDISVFHLASGRKVSVLEDWGGFGDASSFLKKIRQDACGPFKTVLGPGSDAHHRDHMHFDLQAHRSGGSYCR
jgi:hypothetical protein